MKTIEEAKMKVCQPNETLGTKKSWKYFELELLWKTIKCK